LLLSFGVAEGCLEAASDCDAKVGAAFDLAWSFADFFFLGALR
jgi:hypothetical protein